MFLGTQKEKQGLYKCLLCHFPSSLSFPKFILKCDEFDTSEMSSRRRVKVLFCLQFSCTLFEFFATNSVKLCWQHTCHLSVLCGLLTKNCMHLCLEGLTKILCRQEKSNPKGYVKCRFRYGKIEFYTGKKNWHVVFDFDFKHCSVCVHCERKKLSTVQLMEPCILYILDNYLLCNT